MSNGIEQSYRYPRLTWVSTNSSKWGSTPMPRSTWLSNRWTSTGMNRPCYTDLVAARGELANRAVDRVHLLVDDLDWAPSAILRLRKVIVGSLVVGATVPAVLKFGPIVWFVPSIVAPLAMRLGNRGARALARRRLNKFARGEVALARLKNQIDGELLHVRGTVQASETLPGLIAQDPAVYRRVEVSLGRLQIVHEAAVDFALTDQTGQRVVVLAAGSRLLCPMGKRFLIEGESEQRVLAEVRRTHIDQRLRELGVERFETMGDEFVLRPGDAVDIVGYKTRVVDRDIQERLAREEPFRAALQSGERLPLLIAAAAAYEAAA